MAESREELEALLIDTSRLREVGAVALFGGDEPADERVERGRQNADLVERADFYRWIMFAVTELEQPLWRINRHETIYPLERRVPAEIPVARQDFTEMAEVLESHMRGREYVVGARVSAADFVLAYTLDWANEARLLDDFPGLRRYMERMYRRPNAAPRIATAFAALERG